MIRKIIGFFRNIYRKLTYHHLISVHPKYDLLAEGKWHKVEYYIKKIGKEYLVDEFRVKELKSQRRK